MWGIKRESLLGISVVIGFLIALIILVSIPFVFDFTELYKVITQGEILVGLAVAFPTLAIWFFSIQDNRKKIETESSLAVLKIKKEYDLLLKELCSDFDLNFNIFPYRLKNIFKTFEKRIRPFDGEKTETYLDHEIVLKEIFSDKMTEEVFFDFNENPDKLEKFNLIGRSMKLMLDELTKTGRNLCIQEPFMQDFASLKFEFKDFSEQLENEHTDLRLEKKAFYDCTFDTEFIKKVNFRDCKFYYVVDSEQFKKMTDIEKYSEFIESAISDPENEKDVRDKICQLLELDKSIFNYESEVDGIIEDFVENEDEDELRIQDVRDKILLNNMLVHNKYFTIDDIGSSDKKIITDKILDNINKTVTEDVKKENVRISISKNYVNTDNINEYGELVWLGWNSIMENYLDNNPNIEYFVFGVKGETEEVQVGNPKTLYYIVFTLDNFKALLEKKTPHGNGKYHFYFAANKKI